MAAAPEGAARPDLRVVLLAAASWVGALSGFLIPGWGTGLLLAVGSALILRRWRRGLAVLSLVGCLLACGAVATVAMLRALANENNPVAALASDHAFVSATAKVSTDPITKPGQYEPFVLVRVTVSTVTGRGRSLPTRVPVLVVGTAPGRDTTNEWGSLALGETVHISGQLAPPDSRDLAAILSTSRPPVVVGEPGALSAGAARLRAAIRASVASLHADERALIPALVDGDDQGMSAHLVEDFGTSGLTHLAAVSGTNLTLVVGFLLILARWVGIRAKGLIVVGMLGVAGFIMLARTEPSVVRAAAMGSVALVGMGSNGREKGVRALGVAVFALLLFDPWLALSVGFALSTLATAGILFLAPPWRDALMSWTPQWVAEAIAVPLAAQLACTPLIAAISGQVSLVAVLANMLVAFAVGPATVLGLIGGLTMLVLEPVGLACGWLAGRFAWWIIAIAQWSANLPNAAVGWGVSGHSIAVLTVASIVVVFGLSRLLGHRWPAAALALALVVVIVRPLPAVGPVRWPGSAWPPKQWVLIACDVGQGDGIVLNAGDGEGFVVDAGPDPVAMDRCLGRLGVTRLPVIVLTHFHADHVDGLPGVLRGRSAGELDVTATRTPAGGAAAVDRWASAAAVPVRVPAYGETRRTGQLVWQVIGPEVARSAIEHGEEGSVANNASVTLLVSVRGVRILLGGDMEPEAQQRLHRDVPGLRADILKVPHHGSRYQDPALIASLGARLALISVGEGNDYGHPAQATLDLLSDAGMEIRRTDRDGDIAVVVRAGHISVVSRD